MRLAWFSPMPPVRTGIAAVSSQLVHALAGEHVIEVYTDRTSHDFVWRQRQRPYDLTVYQVGNSSHHDYQWPYLFRYPGLAVLHDAHLHHARAAALLRTKRASDYRTEFAANHPDVSPDLAELAVAGFDNHLYYAWPMTRVILQASRLTAVHTRPLAAALREEHPGARVTSIRLAHGEPLTPERSQAARARVRAALGIANDAVLLGVFGGLTPEKRIPQVLDALAAIRPYAPLSHLLLAGAPARHFDVAAAVCDRTLQQHVTIAGYVGSDEELTEHIAACDVSLNLRWPTAREMSGPWLRALAAGVPTITTDLAHLADVPSLDPRTWANREPRTANREPATVAIDILDEDHSLRLAMRRLATDAPLRAALGSAGRAYWDREHSMPRMIEDYRRALAEAAANPAPRVALPAHLMNDGSATLRALLAPFGIESDTVFLR